MSTGVSSCFQLPTHACSRADCGRRCFRFAAAAAAAATAASDAVTFDLLSACNTGARARTRTTATAGGAPASAAGASDAIPACDDTTSSTGSGNAGGPTGTAVATTIGTRGPPSGDTCGGQCGSTVKCCGCLSGTVQLMQGQACSMPRLIPSAQSIRFD